MANAKEEFISHIKYRMDNVTCCNIKYIKDYCSINIINLKVGHTSTDMLNFLQDMDFDYSSEFGSQEVYGTIWWRDGTWSSRVEYDGNEWWEHHEVPKIPQILIKE